MIGWLYRETESFVFDPSSDTIGPWSLDFQHGGPPFALAYHCAQSMADRMVPMSGHLDFIRPVSVCRTEVDVEVVAASRRTRLIDVKLFQNEFLVVRSSLWFRDKEAVVPSVDAGSDSMDYHDGRFSIGDGAGMTSPGVLIDALQEKGLDTPLTSLGRDSEGMHLPWINRGPGFVAASSWRTLKDEFGQRSQSRASWNYRGSVVYGHDTTPEELIFLAADSVWSVSRQFNFSEMTGVNVGIDLTYIRSPETVPLLIAGSTPMATGGGISASGGIFDSLGLCAVVSEPMISSPPRTTRVRSTS